MGAIPFSQRFGNSKEKYIGDDFPQKAKIALCYIFEDLKEKFYLANEKQVILELNRLGRFTSDDIGNSEKTSFTTKLLLRLNKLSWDQVYTFCERAYIKLLTPIEGNLNEDYVPIEEVRNYFSQEINQLINEENLAYYFNQGIFERRGRAQTQQAIEKTGTVLSNPRLEKVKKHFNKARKFFDNRPYPDVENCVKDSLCALEAAVEILSNKRASNDFEKAVKQIEGNNLKQIPSPIAQCMIKLYSYRGSAQGAAHASLQGNRVSIEDAELVLSLTADFITYLVNIFPPEEEIPF